MAAIEVALNAHPVVAIRVSVSRYCAGYRSERWMKLT